MAKKKAKKKVAAKKTKKKKVVKKKAVKKTTVKKKAKTVKKTTKKKISTKVAPTTVSVSSVAKNVKKPRTKSDIMGVLAESSGLSKKEVSVVLENLSELISLDIGKKGPGIFNIPGLMKIVRIHKPATKARKGTNPFTGEPTVFKAKPARSGVKVRPLKALKDMVS